MSKKYHYCYVTTNLITGKKYVGDHSTNNLNDGYLGSGRYLERSIKKYGKEKFKREILEFCESKKEAFDLQEKYINEYNTLSPTGYNISPKGGHNVKNCFSKDSKKKMSKTKKGYKHSQETKDKIKNSLSGYKHSSETKENMKLARQKTPLSIESRNKISNKHKNKKLSVVHKDKISKSLSNKWKNTKKEHKFCWVNSPTLKISKYISLDDLDDHLCNGFIKGRKQKL